MVLLLLLLQFWPGEIAISKQTVFPDNRYQEYDWRSFQQLPEVNETIDLENLDYGLIDAAVFFVSNRYREKYGRKTLSFDPRLRDAADHHAHSMARFEFISHYNKYEPEWYSPDKRGMKFDTEVVAENVAGDFVHRYESGSPYYFDEDIGFLNRRKELIELHTYLSFAEQLVEDWYQSPPHKKNLLMRGLGTLGCAVRINMDDLAQGEIPMAYSVQNFGM